MPRRISGFRGMAVGLVLAFLGGCFPIGALAVKVVPASNDAHFVVVHSQSYDPQEYILSVENDGVKTRPYIVDLFIVRFGANGGVADFLPVSEKERSWFSFSPQQFSLDPATSTAVRVQIAPDVLVGKKQETYALLIREDRVEGDKDSLSAGVASLFFVSFGDVVSTGRVRSFFTSTFDQGTATLVSLSFENTGDVAFVPRGILSVTNMWGKEVARAIFNREGARVPVGALRTLSEVWQHGDAGVNGLWGKALMQLREGFWGKYTITFQDTSSSDVIVQRAVVWLWPKELFLVGGISIVFFVVTPFSSWYFWWRKRR